jgi:hypothetical protein
MIVQKTILASVLCLSAFATSADVLLIDVINKESINSVTGLTKTQQRSIDGSSNIKFRRTR